MDSYKDFPNADQHDGQQPPLEHLINAAVRFERAPEFSAADYYEQSRARTYACCFSLENSESIWRQYSNGSQKGKICVVFNFGKLRATLNRTIQPGNSLLQVEGNPCKQVFSVNYGIVDYVPWQKYRANAEHLPTPIKYAYLKDKQYSDDRELRVSLSALGMGKFVLADGMPMVFPPNLQLAFNFKKAFAEETIL